MIKPEPYVHVVRAVGSEYVMQMFRPIAIGLGIGMLLLSALAIWLTTINVWFWLFDGLVFVLLLALLALLAAFLFAARVVRPTMSREQRIAVRNFTQKLQQTTEDLRTPWPFIAAKIGRDVIFPSKNGYTTRLIESSKTLYPEFRLLQQSFSDS